VLAVDAYPFGVATREVEVAVPVEVPEVAGPVPAESQRAVVGVGVVVVALEGTRPADVHDLADAFVRVDEATGGVEPRGGTFVALLVDDLHVLTDEAECAGAVADFAVDVHPTFGGPVDIDYVDVEPAREGVDDLG